MTEKGWIGVGWFTVILFTILGLYLYQTMKDGSQRTLGNELHRSGFLKRTHFRDLDVRTEKVKSLKKVELFTKDIYPQMDEFEVKKNPDNRLDLSDPKISFEKVLRRSQLQMKYGIGMALNGKESAAYRELDRLNRLLDYMQQYHGFTNDDIQNLIDKMWGESCRPYTNDQYMVFHWTLDYMYKPFD